MVHFKAYLLPTLCVVAFCLYSAILVKRKAPTLHLLRTTVKRARLTGDIQFAAKSSSDKSHRRRPASVVTIKRNLNAQAASNYTASRDTVFIVGYHRTGSSFSGAALSSYPGSFYLFEPLHHFERLKKRQSVTFFNGSQINLTTTVLQTIRRDILHAWASCELKNLPIQLLRPFVGDSLTKFVNCRQSKGNHSGSECRNIVQNKCKSSPLRVVKFINLRMTEIEDLLVSFPYLKFIHLVRDPRGNALSQRGKVHGANMFNISVEYCETIRNDSKSKEHLMALFPGRITTLLYENLAEFPLKEATRLLKFINEKLRLKPKMNQYIRRISMTPEKKCGAYCVERGNSTRMMSKWRQRIDNQSLLLINNVCGDVLDKFGYTKFADIEEVQDLTIPILNP